jgi:hypothetical protein
MRILMRKRTLGVVLVAGLAMSGAGAFTNSNAVDTSVAGVGANTVSGVTVTDIDYTLATAATGEDEISAADFTTGTDIRGKNVILRLKGTGGSVLTTASNLAAELDVCTIDAATGLRVTCNFLLANRADLVAVTSFEVVVYDNDVA